MELTDVLTVIFGAAQAVIQPALLLRSFSRKPRVLFLITFTVLIFAAIIIPLPTPVGVFASTLGVILCCRFSICTGWNEAMLCGVLSSEIMWLCYGSFDALLSALKVLMNVFEPRVVGMIFFFAGNIFPLAAYWLICSAARKLIKNEIADRNSTLIVLVPLLMIFAVEIYIVTVLYNKVDTSVPAKRDIELLIVQLLGTASVFCILFAYKKCADNFALRGKMRLYEQESRFREQYASEIKAYYDTARSLRHDFKNHILIIGELLRKKEYGQAAGYISKLDKTLEGSELKFHTGSPILDIILSAKLSEISDIVKVNCEAVPDISETDICTIFANALDNAVCALSKCSENESGFISITTKKRGKMFFIEIENSFDGRPFKSGTGLANIICTAEKYGGSAKATASGNTFTLKMILCCSQH